MSDAAQLNAVQFVQVFLLIGEWLVPNRIKALPQANPLAPNAAIQELIHLPLADLILQKWSARTRFDCRNAKNNWYFESPLEWESARPPPIHKALQRPELPLKSKEYKPT